MTTHPDLASRGATPVSPASEYARVGGTVLLTTVVALVLRARLAP